MTEQKDTKQSPDRIPWNPQSTSFPSRGELPRVPGTPEDAAWVWGEEDNLGRLNLLTPERVSKATGEIRTGEVVPVNLPLNIPEEPAFGRQCFQQEIKTVVPGVVYDDVCSMNTQSGTQWDGFRHFAHIPSRKFYNNTTGDDIVGPNSNTKCSIHHWAERGIAGRGVLLDYHEYVTKNGIAFDPFETSKISYDELVACGKDQNIDIRPAAQGGDVQIGDMLFIRSGWVEAYHKKSPEEKKELSSRHHVSERFGGLSQEPAILNWLHDSYFATVAGDAPTFEAWPPSDGHYLHEYILSLWGMPLGEMLHLDNLAKKCRDRKQWTFFFTSAPTALGHM
ncbi:Origin recognition complex subunit 5 [Neonectria punicea]|uniref:Origin recognition complex subunit 5 n=1 Tax=Neonectria punicea TaxID=979145 RepID=A0ABR1GZI0_9HYPO